MPFDDSKYHAKAEQGQVGGIALDAGLAVSAIRRALAKVAEATGVDLSKEIAELERVDQSLDRRFDDLTGWTPAEK